MIIISFTPEELKFINDEAKKKMFGRKNTWEPDQTEDRLFTNQLCGQLGNAGLSKLLYGNLDAYKKDRDIANKDKYKGDGGKDIPDLSIDIKTRLAKHGMDIPYKLYVPGWDYHPDVDYVLGIIPEDDKTKIHIMGWKHGTDLILDPIPDNEKRRSISMYKLNPLETLFKKYNIAR